jgi:endonuclease/exonuclease/phosphatase family metal-dependent hydrolase
MTILNKFLKTLQVIILLIIFTLAGIIIIAILTDYKPKEEEIVFTGEKPTVLKDTMALSLLSWNIGYCGLDKDMDFFYEGGEKVFTPLTKCANNLLAVTNFLKQNDSVDFIFIQEIDKGSKRSYNLNEYDSLRAGLKNHSSFFARNYDVLYVPIPLSSPMGRVLSGVAIFSKYQPVSSVRFSFPGKYAFPKQLFMLDRCFLVNRYLLSHGKELVVINTHNEAFDNGQIRKTQMEYLKSFLLKEYEKGNFIIAGGDWNQTPPDFKPDFTANKVNSMQMIINSNYLPHEWKWVYDNTIPSNRSVIAAYDPLSTTTTVIDHFLLSPNVADISIKCINLGFENSDHNPVLTKVKLLK